MTFSTAPSDPTGRDIPLSEPDTSRDVVKFSATKAYVGAAITAAVAILVGLAGLIEDPTVKLVSAIGVLVLGSIGSAFGIYNAPRKAVSN